LARPNLLWVKPSKPAYEVFLDSVKLGDKTFNKVRALVVQGDCPIHVLLGMNVLKHFEIEQQSNLMILRTR
jgi:predicted aspartyl protease